MWQAFAEVHREAVSGALLSRSEELNWPGEGLLISQLILRMLCVNAVTSVSHSEQPIEAVVRISDERVVPMDYSTR